MKIVFAGTPEFAVPSLKKLAQTGQVVAVLTQPDKPQGRKGTVTPPPVKMAAHELGIPVLQPERLRTDYEELSRTGADLMVTCAYGQLLPQEVLDLFPLGVWNIHASLLPAYRGAAPIQQCIIDGAKRTGITVMKTELGMDTGDIFLQRSIAVEADDTGGTLSEKLSLLGAELIAEAVGRIACGDVVLEKQSEGFVCRKVARQRVDFSRSAEEVSRLIRGLSPAPLAYAQSGDLTLNFYMAEAVGREGDEPFGTVVCASPKEGLLIKCGEGAVKITQLQPSGGKRMSAKDFLNGKKLREGMRFE